MKETSKERLISALCAVASIGAFLLIWYLACALTALGKLLPDPVTVLVGMWGYITGTVGKCSLLMHAVHSLRRVLIGFVIGSAIGISLGLLMGRDRLARAIFNPIFRIIRPIPPIAWIPLTVFWFGIGLAGKVFIIWIAGIVPCVINSYVGVRMTNPTLIQMARTYGANNWQIFTQLCIPSALPMVFGALQLALAYCWTNLVAAELLAADSGLGFLITMGGRLGRPDIIVLGMICVGLSGAVIGFIIDQIEKKLLAGIRR